MIFQRAGVSCGAPPSRVGATPSAPAIGYFGDSVTYSCDQTHLSAGGGSGRVTCNSSGLWEEDTTDSLPLCVGGLACLYVLAGFLDAVPRCVVELA